MLENFEFYLFLVLLVTMLIMLAKKIQVAYPILLVLAGLLISFIPGAPQIKVEPELIFIIFYPLYCLRPHGQHPGKSFGGGAGLF